ncbi:hypothetical protein JCM9140_4958 [Halalkalibacter wakoensis JCM 9140]|uniref:Uncharacterized protein n=1 Tax=Halalkalibacter wakoensis JCM 9140 TaxID=1236970 RepID=W4Q9J4_9BACI|nr:hypothetical protein JCM9140_4958 [Halalkalibacter wakoensis JCM 9140]
MGFGINPMQWKEVRQPTYSLSRELPLFIFKKILHWVFNRVILFLVAANDVFKLKTFF